MFNQHVAYCLTTFLKKKCLYSNSERFHLSTISSQFGVIIVGRFINISNKSTKKTSIQIQLYTIAKEERKKRKDKSCILQK